jgi:regulator of protease activity HflC (stomatin/prohibitin superfamily)
VAVEKVLLRNITLPEKVKSAIEAKLAAEQEAERMQFVPAKERQEAERREVEAQGVAKAQQIIQGTLTENYIRYLWVKALENNAQHPSTVIYVPIGQDGLPLVQNVIPRGRGASPAEPTAR